jgi:hypothetical protein
VLPIEYCQLGLDSDPTVDAILGSQIVVRAKGFFRSFVLNDLIKLQPFPITSETRRTILRDIFIN